MPHRWLSLREECVARDSCSAKHSLSNIITLKRSICEQFDMPVEVYMPVLVLNWNISDLSCNAAAFNCFTSEQDLSTLHKMQKMKECKSKAMLYRCFRGLMNPLEMYAT